MNEYADMLNLPHHRSPKRAGMNQQDRAAQFAPFAALSGYELEIAEAARLTEREIELTEWAAQQVDEGLQAICRELHRHPEVTVTWFQPDCRKAGGTYRTVTARVRKIVEPERWLFLDGDIRIPVTAIVSISLR